MDVSSSPGREESARVVASERVGAYRCKIVWSVFGLERSLVELGSCQLVHMLFSESDSVADLIVSLA